MDAQILDVNLSDEAQRLYLNYALSVITSRALPDVRDGLKPVQRRILFAMHHELRLAPEGKPAKCARIVGEVIGKYHPHGDSAVYDALVRMAQEWVMSATLVDGQGNFGSQDGDPAAAYRYTEARLTPIARELLIELSKRTVRYRPTFDSTRFEPIVLPARTPNLLVNGAQGIAVGMATSIPPHNLTEVCAALRLLIDNPKATLGTVMGKIKGPDFPTHGELISDKATLREVYKTGHGTLKLRAQWKLEEKSGQTRIILTSIPYAVEKQSLVEKIADVIVGRKLTGLVDVRDESTEDVRVVLELKKGTRPELVMAYLAKHTPVQTNVQVNLTCLAPTDNPEIATPRRMGLLEILRAFLDFRMEVVTNRLQFDLDELEKRLHILDGFEKVFDALDEIIKIIRRSNGKADAAKKIVQRFDLDEIQTDAILELKLYRLAKLEILLIQEEADKKRKAAQKIRGLLRSKAKRWALISDELADVQKQYGVKRRTKILSDDDTPEFSAEDFIEDEDNTVILTAHGWMKRQQTVKDLASTRVRKDDWVLACTAGSTRSCVTVFSSKGHAYTQRLADVAQSTGHGEPVQNRFKFTDGERVTGMISFDPRLLELPEEEEVYEDGSPCPPYGVAVTKLGMALRFPLFGFREPSTKNGRRFCKLSAGDEVLSVFLCPEEGYLIAAATDGHAIAVDAEELSLLSGPGKGSMLIKLQGGAQLLGATVAPGLRSGSLKVVSDKGKPFEFFAEGLLATRGGRGKAVVKRTGFREVVHELPTIPALEEE